MSRKVIYFLILVTPALAICLALLGVITLPTNPLGGFLVLIGIVYTLGIIIVTFLRRLAYWEVSVGKRNIREESGDRSFWLITLAIMAVFYLSPLEYIFLPAWLPRTGWMGYSGVGLVLLGGMLFIWARHTLGESYSGHVSVKEGQELVQTGPYRFMRHPAYAGYLLITLGVSLGYSSLLGLASFILLFIPILRYRVHIEERILEENFAEKWTEYSNRVSKFFPSLSRRDGQ